MTTAVVTCTNLQKHFKDFKLGPINLQLNAGETVGLMGKNGAGKTTFYQLLSGNLDASEGDIYISDKRMLPEQYTLKRQIGYLPQHMQLPQWATAHELLTYTAQLHELANPDTRVQELSRWFDCDSFLHVPVAKCSHGMQKRIGLAIANIHTPSFLILDEPFSGLDLYHIHALQQTIQDRQSQGLTTLICTHIAPYAAKLCQRILLLDNGELSICNPWPDLNQLERIDWIDRFFFPEEKTS